MTPATPIFQTLRLVSETLTPQFETVVSNEIRKDNEVSEVRRSGISATGEAAFELHRNANLEEMMAAALRGAWTADVLKAASLQKAFTFERNISNNLGQIYYLRFEGLRIGGMSLNIAPEEYVTGSFRLSAAGSTASNAILTGATYPEVAGVNGSPMVGVDVTTLTVGGAAGADFLALTIDVENSLRMQRKIGQKSVRGIGYGRRAVTGTLRIYFEDLQAYNLLLADTTSSIVATISDGVNSFTITIPRIRFTGGEVPNPGNDQDFVLTLNWQATIDATLATSLQIARA